MHHPRANKEPRFSSHWSIVLVAGVMLISSLGCSLARRIEPLVLAAGPQDRLGAHDSSLATRTPWPTFTPTAYYSPTPLPTATPSSTATLTDTPTPTDTPIPTPTATATTTPIPSATSRPTSAPAPIPPTARPTATFTPTPSYAYQALELYTDHTSNPFLTGYVAIVNWQEIPIGGIKAVGSFEPGDAHYESPLSKWFFEGYSAPGPVTKSSSVKFEPPGGIQDGTWLIHLEDEGGTRLSEDVTITTDPSKPEWFFIKFKQPTPQRTNAATPTPSWGSNTTPWPTPTRYVTPIATSGPTPTPTPTTTTMPPTAGWSFANVQAIADQDQEMVIVYGDMVNNTGSSQELSRVTGTFYDDQGQVIAGPDATDDRWPVQVVPPEGRMPFEVTVYEIQSVADFDLEVVSQPTGDTPRQDFEFFNLDTSSRTGAYCVVGRLRNPGGRLSHYLVIGAALYNNEDKVINFDSVEVPNPGLVVGDSTLGFSTCIETHNRDVVNYTLEAWGQ